jgi:hypothetical protein
MIMSTNMTRTFYCPEVLTPVSSTQFYLSIADFLSSVERPQGSGHPDRRDEGTCKDFPVAPDIFQARWQRRTGQPEHDPTFTDIGGIDGPDLPPGHLHRIPDFLPPRQLSVELSLQSRHLVGRRRGTVQQPFEVAVGQRDGPERRPISSGESDAECLQGILGRGAGDPGLRGLPRIGDANPAAYACCLSTL